MRLKHPFAAAAAAIALALAQPACAGYAPIGNQITANPSATFTFPATTPTYAVGQLMANNATAGSVVPLSWSTAALTATCSFDLWKMKLSITNTGTGIGTGLDGMQILVRFFTAAATYGSGDAAAYRVTTGGATVIGTMTCTLTQYDDAATGVCYPADGQLYNLKLASGTTIYADLTAQGAYARQASKVVTGILYEKQDIC